MSAFARRLDVVMCSGCLSKMREIDEQKKVNERQRRRIADLETRLGERGRSETEKPFGESTPSSKMPFKKNASTDKRARKGGAKKGHRGHGRKYTAPPAGPPEDVPAPCICGKCGGATEHRRTDTRTVQDYIPERTVTRRFTVETRACTTCGEIVEAKVSGVRARRKYSNAFDANCATQIYLDGRTQGDVCERLHVGSGALNYNMQALGTFLEPCMPRLLQLFLDDPVRFADETTLREDGVGRYAWLFSTAKVALFLAGQSRASSVPLDLFAPFIEPDSVFAGVLVVDRYAVYGKLFFLLQYCYAHLKRDLDELRKKHPRNAEIRIFCRLLRRQLVAAIKLRRQARSDMAYYKRAAEIKAEIIAITETEARHPDIQAFQNIFRKNKHRLYHWARDRRVPADNNYSERSLRPLVIARKLSFGTQSAKGSHTRSILMTVLHSLKKQGHDPAVRIREALDLANSKPEIHIADFLFPLPTEHPPPLRRAPDEGIHVGVPLTSRTDSTGPDKRMPLRLPENLPQLMASG